MSRNIVFEGWLTKSPPNRRIWRTRWRRRWFALRQSGELPGQYFLDYYADRNCRRLKGTIDLDLCEQVDAGLHMERHGQAPLNPNLRGSVFTIQTQRRTYHLEADCEAEMEKWVDAICRVCGLRATEDSPPATSRHNVLLDTYQNNLSAISAINDHYECADGTGPYIPISECITGVRAQDEQRHFTFEPKSLTMGSRNVGQQYNSQPHIRINSELSENDSNLSDEDDGSFHASHQNLHWSVTKSFTKLSVAPRNNGSAEGPPVPPRPPKTFANRNRELPPKDPFQGPKIHEPAEAHDSAQHAQAQHAPVQHAQAQHAQAQPAPVQHAQAPHVQVQHAQAPHVQVQHAQTQHPQVQHAQTQHPLTQPPQVQHAQTQHPQVQHAQTQHPQVQHTQAQHAQAQHAQAQHAQAQHAQAQHAQAQHPQAQHVQPRLRVPRRTSQGAPSSPRPQAPIAQEEEESAAGPSSMQYCNLPSIPPVVDRALKPRLSIHSVAHVNTVMVQGGLKLAQAEEKSDVLQYLDLDLPTSSSEASGSDPSNPRKKVDIIHGRSSSSADTDAYKTVDFLKTEAFNITRQDAEASRSFQY